MKKRILQKSIARLALSVAMTSVWMGVGLARAQTAIEINIERPPFAVVGSPYNHSSQDGFPLSTTVDTPAGSNGAAPTVAEQTAKGLTTNQPTGGQFQSFGTFGFAAGPSFRAGGLGAQSNDGSVVLMAVEIGASVVSRQVSFSFGAEIPVPSTDENDSLLAGDPQNYWFVEPHTTNDHADGKYYFSSHALKVFAVSPGTIEIVWKKIASTVAEPADYVTHPENYFLDGGRYFTLFRKTYLVSGNAVKPPQKIFWTEAGFNGPPVNIPSERIDDVHVVYNSDVPEFVSIQEALANERSTPPVTVTNTVFFSRQKGLNQLKAFNREGRVFLELLGQSLGSGGRRQHLGLEIVDLLKEPIPADLNIELGERVAAYPDGREDSTLNPEPVIQGSQTTFLFRYEQARSENYYAVHETRNQNDVLVYWLRPSLEGIEWPFLYNRYSLFWPSEESKYSHYLRPEVTNKDAASATAVALPSEYATEIAYQDPVTAPFGAHVTPDLRFYTYLSSTIPQHRTLLQYSLDQDIGFERVYSRLATSSAVTPGEFAAGPPPEGFPEFDDADSGNKGVGALSEIRFVHQIVDVGQRIVSPSGEEGNLVAEGYLAGYINKDRGNGYNPGAYLDPFTGGFEAADQGAIIPINAIPGANEIEVWWFRPSNLGAARGFRNIYWPSVVGRYTVRWPESPREIILASNDGSGPLPSLEAKGAIYVQNDDTAPGYNPNEEHAIMAGGQAFALRDDLNVTAVSGYTSEPFVLVDHDGSDGRPEMAAFKVLREKPDDAIVFDFTREVPLVQQPPMPLPLMDLIVRGDGVTQLDNLSEELVILPGSGNIDTVGNSLFGGGFFAIEPATESLGTFALNSFYLLVNPNDPLIQLWYYAYGVDSPNLAGFLAFQRPYLLESDSQAADSVIVSGERSLNLNVGDYVVLLDSDSGTDQTGLIVTAVDAASRRITFNGALAGGPWTEMTHSVVGGSPGMVDDWLIYRPEDLDYAPTDDVINPFVFEDRKGTLWLYRGRHNDQDDTGFAMRYYYKTREGFYFPGVAPQPSIGTITPYLREFDTDADAWGGPATGKAQQALPIVYRPVWPSNPAQMPRGYTLADPALGLPAVRGQSSVLVLY